MNESYCHASATRLVQDGHAQEEWAAALNALGAGGALEIDDTFGVYVLHERRDDGPGLVRLHVPRPGFKAGCDLNDEAMWDDRFHEFIRAAAVALGIIDGPQS